MLSTFDGSIFTSSSRCVKWWHTGLDWDEILEWQVESNAQSDMQGTASK